MRMPSKAQEKQLYPLSSKAGGIQKINLILTEDGFYLKEASRP